ncbi:MAG: hypothetical protein A2939_01155 [Parcubacteria group bacterium RIFCSPLOWO2_01_FULL_48_18]|nr:MAG: hypothetical protein A2939_01155 [Parcubacteria group bacterium RIFCSPLOWO2_01_FULL_48_18]OHB23158.1 MAG: hypothetical protein A3J67_00655 [Parcubacteria group bacterium RIFCSPHIGHO2_02_FULL_48_10b]
MTRTMQKALGNVEPKETDLVADHADLVSLKADLRNLYRRFRERGSFCRTKTVEDEVLKLLKLYHALPV